jgi:hypothetical protein
MRVLIVEDEALVAMEIEGMLGLAGHEAVGRKRRSRTSPSSTSSSPRVRAGSTSPRP